MSLSGNIFLLVTMVFPVLLMLWEYLDTGNFMSDGGVRGLPWEQMGTKLELGSLSLPVASLCIRTCA